MYVITETTQCKYILLITQIIIVHVNLLPDKTNISNESQKTLSPSNIWQASWIPTLHWQDTNTMYVCVTVGHSNLDLAPRPSLIYCAYTNTNLNNFIPTVNYNIKIPMCVMMRYRNQQILKIIIYIHVKTIQ
jgi:hypothetical protein